MNITREEIGTLNEILKVSVTPEDYQKTFDSELKKLQRSMSLPGFRPGHVPAGLVKKKYGKAVLIDELNKIVSGKLESFITESKLDLLGSPIPQPSNDEINNFDEPGEFEFIFEIGLAPDFDLTLPPKHTFPYYNIVVDDKKVTEYIDDLRRKYGKFSNPEASDENSILYGDFVQIDDAGNPVENGLKNKSTLSVAAVSDSKIKKQLAGIKKGDVITIDLHKAFKGNENEIAHMLNVSPETAAGAKGNFSYTVDTVNHIEKAEMNQEFFDKIFGEGAVKSEEEFTAKIHEQLENYNKQDSDFKLKHDLEDYLLQELDLKLPDSFLQKWLQTAVEKPLTPEQVEKEYNGYARGMKLRLIENKVFRDQKLNISQDEIRDMAGRYIMQQFQGYTSGLTDDLMNNLIDRYLEKRESVERLIETISGQKVFDYLKSVVKTKPQDVSYEEFMKIVKDHKHD